MPKEGPLAAVTTFSMAMERYEVPDLNGAALKARSELAGVISLIGGVSGAIVSRKTPSA
jgi:hypothetical protein